MAVENVRRRLLETTAALARHQVRYAVVGGHAVAIWVARFDEDAVRNTVDVDLLIRRADLPRATQALAELGYDLTETWGVTLFVERKKPSPRRGIHMVFAGERVRPHEPHPAPLLDRVEMVAEGFAVIDLLGLLVMKLTANRDKDRVHLRDMLELDMISAELAAQLPDDLRQRLDWIRAHPE